MIYFEILFCIKINILHYFFQTILQHFVHITQMPEFQTKWIVPSIMTVQIVIPYSSLTYMNVPIPNCSLSLHWSVKTLNRSHVELEQNQRHHVSFFTFTNDMHFISPQIISRHYNHTHTWYIYKVNTGEFHIFFHLISIWKNSPFHNIMWSNYCTYILQFNLHIDLVTSILI